MRTSAAVIYDPELEWSLREDSQVIYNLKRDSIASVSV
jgi:hypothetical protein